MSQKVQKGIRILPWIAYLIIVFEILYMISPFAFYFYSIYGVPLGALSGNAKTHWLTSFVLPHYTESSVAIINIIPDIGLSTMSIGIVLFIIAFCQIYYAKFTGRGAVIGGLYRIIRHPQYTALAIIGFGATIFWSRMIVIITYVTMLFLYYYLARAEENECKTKFGASYNKYYKSTGMFLPKYFFSKLQILPKILPQKGFMRFFSIIILYCVSISLIIGISVFIRIKVLASTAVLYTENTAVISTSYMKKEKLESLYNRFSTDNRYREAIKSGNRFIVYFQPEGWNVPELPHVEGEALDDHTNNTASPGTYRAILVRAQCFDPLSIKEKHFIFNVSDRALLDCFYQQ